MRIRMRLNLGEDGVKLTFDDSGDAEQLHFEEEDDEDIDGVSHGEIFATLGETFTKEDVQMALARLAEEKDAERAEMRRLHRRKLAERNHKIQQISKRMGEILAAKDAEFAAREATMSSAMAHQVAKMAEQFSGQIADKDTEAEERLKLAVAEKEQEMRQQMAKEVALREQQMAIKMVESMAVEMAKMARALAKSSADLQRLQSTNPT